MQQKHKDKDIKKRFDYNVLLLVLAMGYGLWDMGYGSNGVS